MVSAEGIESANRTQTEHLSEHSWQFKAGQVNGGHATDFRNQFRTKPLK
jgi:hypothetical protein